MISVLFSFFLFFSFNIPVYSTDLGMYKSVIPAEYDGTFRKIHVNGDNGVYLVTGETSLKNRVFYSVEDGHVEFIHEKKILVKKKFPKWTSFKIIMEIPRSKLPHNGSLILNLYERTSRGETVKVCPVILENFYDLDNS